MLLRQLESVDKEVDYVQKQIAVIAREDEDVKRLMTIPGIDYYSTMIIKNEIGEIERFPSYKELCSLQRVYFNKEQYFEGISKEVWEYQIGGYQVMEKYMKDRKKRKLSMEEIEHYMKVAKAIERTIEVQEKIKRK